ncbi:uncharacterized protein MONOS_12532 [Monocercomonoides exilis]|uniref:uncharacterized protein n=1 Tax=Monocercomonoides exilis TaxID=2049356 RepID=UPI003559635B|nr:hypothetical protein MONOS_12532 [Monocercomonoides exilis]|eukprot:MONOS_12532.1-p1 / transcript=MONOS_12532.1 / gene=MONOS_12532 / organism=Monocercomonoides_exilis_PA203 / gene_product=unspecified product / transcript_product=unspecified product / location=Mono_scaffold00698:17599-18510(-) / protein_length=304 / sequence_SO=supercontig / SO=protein_coding / is_pseudo=false
MAPPWFAEQFTNEHRTTLSDAFSLKQNAPPLSFVTTLKTQSDASCVPSTNSCRPVVARQSAKVEFACIDQTSGGTTTTPEYGFVQFLISDDTISASHALFRVLLCSCDNCPSACVMFANMVDEMCCDAHGSSGGTATANEANTHDSTLSCSEKNGTPCTPAATDTREGTVWAALHILRDTFRRNTQPPHIEIGLPCFSSVTILQHTTRAALCLSTATAGKRRSCLNSASTRATDELTASTVPSTVEPPSKRLLLKMSSVQMQQVLSPLSTLLYHFGLCRRALMLQEALAIARAVASISDLSAS